MRILNIRSFAQELSNNSYNIQEIGLARALCKLGHTCDVVLYTKSKKTHCELDGKNKIFYFPGWTISKMVIFPALLRRKYYKNYDVIHVNGYTHLMTVLLPLVTKKPKVLYVGPYRDIKNKWFQRVFDFFFLRWIINHYPIVLCKSHDATIYMKEKRFLDPVTVGVGLNIENFSKEFMSDSSTREIFANKRPTLLFVGQLVERKNPLFLLDVIRVITSRVPNIQLVMIGKGPLLEEIESKVNELNLHDHIILKDRVEQSQLVHYYRQSRIFVLPSDYEIFGMVLMEAMWFKMPTVSLPYAGAKVVVEHGVDGFILEDKEVESWADLLVNLLNDPDLSNRIGVSAKKKIENEFTWAALADEFEKKYQKAITSNIFGNLIKFWHR